MPVTARLSLKFYERFGEDIAKELVDWFNDVDATYRSDLRELNELNFARFEAKLDQRIAELRSDMERRFVMVDARFETLESRLIGRLEVMLERQRASVAKWLLGTMLAALGSLLAVLLRPA